MARQTLKVTHKNGASAQSHQCLLCLHNICMDLKDMEEQNEITCLHFFHMRWMTQKEFTAYTVELQWLEHYWPVYHGCFKLVLVPLGKTPISADLG